jgi:hypothetical protein
MIFGKLYKQELKIAYDKKYFVFLVFILLLAIGFPFYGISSYVFGQIPVDEIPAEMKGELLKRIENLLLSRFTLTMLIFTAWSVFPKLFYGGKDSGEVEAKLSIGYSARRIWFSKALAVITVAIAICIPLTLIIYLLMKIYFLSSFAIYGQGALFSWLQGFILNPILVFGVVLLAGGFQLLSDDVRLSSLAVMFLGFVNVGSMVSMKGNTAMVQVIRNYLIIYAIAFIVLLILNLFINKYMRAENVVISTLSFKRKKEQN